MRFNVILGFLLFSTLSLARVNIGTKSGNDRIKCSLESSGHYMDGGFENSKFAGELPGSRVTCNGKSFLVYNWQTEVKSAKLNIRSSNGQSKVVEVQIEDPKYDINIDGILRNDYVVQADNPILKNVRGLKFGDTISFIPDGFEISPNQIVYNEAGLDKSKTIKEFLASGAAIEQTPKVSCVYTGGVLALQLNQCNKPTNLCLAGGVRCIKNGIVSADTKGVLCAMKSNGECPSAYDCLHDNMKDLGAKRIFIYKKEKLKIEKSDSSSSVIAQ